MFMFLNQNKVLWGVSMLLLQFGARYVLGDLGKVHEVLLSHEVTKKLVILAMFFVATRDIVVSFVLTIAYIVVIDGILHEEKKFSLVPRELHRQIINTSTNQVSQEDYKKAQNIVKLYEERQQKENNHDEQDLSYLKYVTNISLANK